MIRRQQSLDDFMSDLLNGSGQASPTIVTDNARAPSGSVTPPSPLVCYLDHLKFHDDRIGITFPSTSARQSKSRWDAESSPRSIRQTKVGLILPLRRQESRERVQQEKEREKPAVSHSYKSIPLMGDATTFDDYWGWMVGWFSVLVRIFDVPPPPPTQVSSTEPLQSAIVVSTVL